MKLGLTLGYSGAKLKLPMDLALEAKYLDVRQDSMHAKRGIRTLMRRCALIRGEIMRHKHL